MYLKKTLVAVAFMMASTGLAFAAGEPIPGINISVEQVPGSKIIIIGNNCKAKSRKNPYILSCEHVRVINKENRGKDIKNPRNGP